MSLHLQPVGVALGNTNMEGQLVFKDGLLVAVLVRLSDEYEEDAGKWFLEAGFGPVETTHGSVFADLDVAQSWIEQRLALALQRP